MARLVTVLLILAITVLSGQQIKKIDNTGNGDFVSLTAAVNYLNGLTTIPDGGIVFNITAGQVFSETLPPITADGAATNKVVFKKDGNGNNPIIQNETSPLDNGVVFFNSASYITFDGVDIIDPNPDNASRYEAGIYVFGSNNIVYKNSSITDFNKYGVYIKDASINVTIENCKIYYSDSFLTSATSIYGVNAAYNASANNINILRNKIYGLKVATAEVYGIRLNQINGTIANNFVSLKESGNDKVYGIRLDNKAGKELSAYFNTVFLSGTATDEGYALYMTGAAGTFNVKNNIFINNRTDFTNQMAVFTGFNAMTFNFSHNVYYCANETSLFLGKWYQTVCNSLTAWQTASNTDEHSIVKSIDFAQALNNDLHLDDTSIGDTELTGLKINNITIDIDGDTRFDNPYRGADENSAVPLVFGLNFSVDSLGFGNCIIGQNSEPKNVVIRNDGNCSINVNSIVVQTGFEIRKFGITEWSNSIAQFVLNTGDSAIIQVSFKPQSSQNYIAELQINTNDLHHLLYKVDLFGAGVLISPPTNLTSEAGNGWVKLNWNAPVKLGRVLAGYNVYRDSNLIKSNIDSLRYSDLMVVNGTIYNYFVTSIYANPTAESSPSNTVQATPFSPQPEISLNSDYFDFESVLCGQFKIDTLKISNVGIANLIIDSIKSANRFYLSNDGINWNYDLFGLTILPGLSKNILVKFAPVALQTYQADIVVKSNDFDENTIFVTLTGKGSKISLQPVTNPFAHLWYSSSDWGDYDNDGDLDLLISGYGSNSSSSTKLFRNDGNNSFVDMTAQPGFKLVAVGNSNSLFFDYDNDGKLDIYLNGQHSYINNTSQDSVRLYHNTGSGFAEVDNPFITTTSGSVDAGDLDNDGDLDLFVTGEVVVGESITKIYQNDGTGSFSVTDLSIPNFSNGDADLGDFDNDGDLDIAITGSIGSFNYVSRIYRNDGDFVFTDISAGFVGLRYSKIKWGDFNNDGKLDVLLSGSPNNESNSVGKIYLNQGNGTFTDSNLLPNNIGVKQGDVDWGDLDNDGDLDVIINGLYTYTWWVGHIYLNENNTLTLADSLVQLKYAEISLVDYDNDKDLDMFLNGRYDYQDYRSILFENKLTTLNHAPMIPAQPSVTVQDTTAIITWNSVTDPEIATNGVTYNLRIRSGNGWDNIWNSQTNLTSGKRTVAEMGNMQTKTSFTVPYLHNGTYYASVQAIDNCFINSLFSPERSFVVNYNGIEDDDIPLVTTLAQNYPNPFNNLTVIDYQLASENLVRLSIFNARGQKVKELLNSRQKAGKYSINFDASGLNSGVYVYKLETEGKSMVKKMIFVK